VRSGVTACCDTRNVSTPRRHHFVQRAYLDRFADGGQVFVRRRDRRTFQTSTGNVAVETGLYDISDETGERSTLVEERLSLIEGPAMAAMSRLDESGLPPQVGTADREALCRYLGLQSTRTPETRERIFFSRRVADYASGRQITRELIAEYLEMVHLGFRPEASEISAAFDFVTVNLQAPETLTPEFAIGMMLELTRQIAPVLDGMWWTVESDRKARLITSDAPLIVWRKSSPRDEYEGVGIATAEELRFPLDPGKQLVLTPGKRTPTARIDSERAHEVNADVASACHRFVVSHPRNAGAAKALVLSANRPVIRFNSGPLYVDGERQEGEVLHTWVPRRQRHP
jgi:Protein of unknown function (DUF4238)